MSDRWGRRQILFLSMLSSPLLLFLFVAFNGWGQMAMLRVERELENEGLKARILLQVHDELLLEVPLDIVERVGSVVRRAMEGVYPLEVPLAVDQMSGESWMEV